MRWSVLIAGATIGGATTVGAQLPQPPNMSAEATVLWTLRTYGGPGDAVRLLRQADSTRGQAQLDALADSLTAYVVEHADQYEKINSVSLVMEALGKAAAVDGDGIPYDGAADRLVRIARLTELGSGALSYLARSLERAEAVRRLKALAVTDPKLALAAFDMLEQYCGPEGLEALEQLYRARAVQSPMGRHVLERIAVRRGWERDPTRDADNPTGAYTTLLWRSHELRKGEITI